MHELQFNVAQLLKEPTGATRIYKLDEEITGEFENDIKLVSPLVGHIEFLRTGSNILVTGLLETTLQKVCGRCLINFTTPLSIELEEEFYPVINILTGAPVSIPDDVEPANLLNEQNILDLSETIRQELVVVSEGVRYCRPDCRGICPHCGQDQNTNPCDCENSHIDPRWAGLQALQNKE
jgi:uncharacterized protein